MKGSKGYIGAQNISDDSFLMVFLNAGLTIIPLCTVTQQQPLKSQTRISTDELLETVLKLSLSTCVSDF